MSVRELGDHLARAWLAELDPWDKSLIDTGRRHHGNEVFEITVKLPGQDPIQVSVFRYTHLNSQHSVLAFCP